MKDIKGFKTFCNFVLPLVYSDELSYYEQMCKVSQKLNEIINQTNLNSEQIENLTNFVNNYFSNLDVQEEINNKLDEMYKDGELSFIEYTLPNKKVVFLGDSLTWGSLDDGTQASMTIPSRFQFYTNCKAINLGVKSAGITSLASVNYYQSIVNNMDSIKDADYIFLQIGWNDVRATAPIGNLNSSQNYFCGALNTAVKYILNNLTNNGKLYLISFYPNNFYYSNKYFMTVNKLCFYDYNDAIIRVATENNVPYIDMLNTLPTILQNCLEASGVHFNAIGYDIIAKTLSYAMYSPYCKPSSTGTSMFEDSYIGYLSSAGSLIAESYDNCFFIKNTNDTITTFKTFQNITLFPNTLYCVSIKCNNTNTMSPTNINVSNDVFIAVQISGDSLTEVARVEMLELGLNEYTFHFSVSQKISGILQFGCRYGENISHTGDIAMSVGAINCGELAMFHRIREDPTIITSFNTESLTGNLGIKIIDGILLLLGNLTVSNSIPASTKLCDLPTSVPFGLSVPKYFTTPQNVILNVNGNGLYATSQINAGNLNISVALPLAI